MLFPIGFPSSSPHRLPTPTHVIARKGTGGPSVTFVVSTCRIYDDCPYLFPTLLRRLPTRPSRRRNRCVSPLPQAHSFPTVWGRRDSGSFSYGPTFPFSPARVAAFALGFPSSLPDLGEEGFGRNRSACALPSSSLFRPLLADATMLSAFAARSFQIAAGFPAGRIVSPPVVASSGRLDIIDPLSVGCGPGKD
ncbi:unnamed protein product [Ixodes pacificus]